MGLYHMGLFCSRGEYTSKEFTCNKCGATFNKNKINRTSCRVHTYVNNECINCYKSILTNSNCYHIKKQTTC